MTKVILIGASKSLLESKLGNIIDTYDVVCRMNSSGRPDIVNVNNQSIIGIKKNIWLCKHIANFNLFNNHGYDDIVGFAQISSASVKMHSNTAQTASAKGSAIIIECINVLKKFNDYNSRPSCGILSIFYLLNEYGKIHICGMDGFKGGHWYGNKFIKQQNKSDEIAAKGLGAHNAIKEQEYINHLIQNGKIKIIDE